MDDAVFQRIAMEIKALHNQGLQFMQAGRFAEAEEYYQRALAVTSALHYHDGMAVSFYNLANLEATRGHVLEAIAYGAEAKAMHEKAQTDPQLSLTLLKRLAKQAMKTGVQHEQAGRLQPALDHYLAAIPFAEAKYQEAMLHEVELIERVMTVDRT